MLRNNFLRYIYTSVIIAILIIICWGGVFQFYNRFDHFVLDKFYEAAIAYEKTPSRSPNIVYLTLTDSSYSSYLQRNALDRSELAKLFRRLDSLEVEAVAVDLIFLNRATDIEDSILSNTIQDLDNIYLPVAFSISQETAPVKIDQVNNIDRFLSPVKKEIGSGDPYEIGKKIYSSIPMIFDVTQKSGHITFNYDGDGVLRNGILLFKYGDKFYPSLVFSIFLDYMGVKLSEIEVNWGKHIFIPKKKDNWLNENIYIPIDERGRMVVPFIEDWGKDFPAISFENFMDQFDDPVKRGRLFSEFSGKIIFLGDISIGSVDLCRIPFNNEAPLIMMHTAGLNAMLNNIFITRWGDYTSILISLLLAMISIFSIVFMRNRFITIALFLFISLFLFSFAWYLMINFIQIPVTSLYINFFFAFVITLAIEEVVKYNLERIKRFRKEIETNRIVDELKHAKRLQQSLLPKVIPQSDKYELWGKCIPAKEVSGDFYDFFSINEDRLGILTADVAGKGMQAAILAILTSGVFWQAIRDKNESLGELINRISSTIYIKKPEKRLFVAFNLSIFDFETSNLNFSNCGQPYTKLLREGKIIEIRNSRQSLPLGAMSKFEYHADEFPFQKNDIFILFSDGISEASDIKQIQFADEELDISLEKCKYMSVNEMGEFIIHEVKKFAYNINSLDDITLIIIKIL